MYEERLGDVSRAVLKKLTEEGVVEGFDNPNWELKMPTKDQLALELVAFTVPGVAMRVAQKGKEISKERKFKKKAPNIQKDIESSEKIEEESKVELQVWDLVCRTLFYRLVALIGLSGVQLPQR